MKWLEVGCPYCPAVLTLPSSASGRTIACPECGKNYLVPTEQASRQSEAPTIEQLASQWISEAEDDDALRLSSSGVVPAEALRQGAAPSVAPPPPPPSAMPAKSSIPWSKEASAAAKKTAAAREMTPEVDADSPLPEVEILAAPKVRRPAPSHPAEERSTTIVAKLPPTKTAPPDVGPTPDAVEAQLRIRRTQMRAMINLAILVVGTLLMIGFGYLVIHFSRRR